MKIEHDPYLDLSRLEVLRVEPGIQPDDWLIEKLGLTGNLYGYSYSGSYEDREYVQPIDYDQPALVTAIAKSTDQSWLVFRIFERGSSSMFLQHTALLDATSEQIALAWVRRVQARRALAAKRELDPASLERRRAEALRAAQLDDETVKAVLGDLFEEAGLQDP